MFYRCLTHLEFEHLGEESEPNIEEKSVFARFLVVFPLLALGSVTAQAAPILWTLQGFGLDDGGTASGSFVYDVDTNTYSSIDIITTAGSARAGTTYTVLNTHASFTANQFFAATTPSFAAGSPGLIFGFSNLTDAGGTISEPFLAFDEGPYNSSLAGLTVDSTYRQATSGQLTSGQLTSGVPEPSALILVAAGFALFLFRRRGHFRYT